MCVSVRCAAMRWLTASCDYCTENSLLPHSAPAVKHNCFFFSFCSQFLTFILCQDSHFLICVPSLYVLSYSFNCYKDLSIIVLRLFRFYFPGDLKKKKMSFPLNSILSLSCLSSPLLFSHPCILVHFHTSTYFSKRFLEPGCRNVLLSATRAFASLANDVDLAHSQFSVQPEV